jgi:hypothetical protein
MSRRFATVILRGRNELQALSALVISRQENPLNPGGSKKHEAEIDGWTENNVHFMTASAIRRRPLALLGFVISGVSSRRAPGSRPIALPTSQSNALPDDDPRHFRPF